ncbi:MAG: hypothetical protein CMI60_03545 [Parvibaculum sp.]|nr:hypothetical protein [Parvibaculum sp.]
MVEPITEQKSMARLSEENAKKLFNTLAQWEVILTSQMGKLRFPQNRLKHLRLRNRAELSLETVFSARRVGWDFTRLKTFNF